MSGWQRTLAAVPLQQIPVRKTKNIALVAHDNKKAELLTWAQKHAPCLKQHNLFGTGTSAKLLSENLSLPVKGFLSGPLGGDQQLGSKIAEGEIDMLIFFWDPLESQPHEPDIRALLRLATLYNIPFACNSSSADFLMSSPLISSDSFKRLVLDFTAYKNRLHAKVEEHLENDVKWEPSADDVQG